MGNSLSPAKPRLVIYLTADVELVNSLLAVNLKLRLENNELQRTKRSAAKWRTRILNFALENVHCLLIAGYLYQRLIPEQLLVK